MLTGVDDRGSAHEVDGCVEGPAEDAMLDVTSSASANEGSPMLESSSSGGKLASRFDVELDMIKKRV